MTDDAAPWREMLRPVVSSTPWVVAHDFRGRAEQVAARLEALGAPSTRVVAGAGSPEGHPGSVVLGVESSSMMGGIRAMERALQALPDDVIAGLDRWDPRRRARVWRPFYATRREIAGRPVFGIRPPAWSTSRQAWTCPGT
jgi:hypothetical protein